MEKCQLSIQNLNNLWSFIKVYAVFVPNLCGGKSVQRKFVWRKNDKYEGWVFILKKKRTFDAIHMLGLISVNFRPSVNQK